MTERTLTRRDETRVDWTLLVDLPADAELHGVIRDWLAERPADPRAVTRAVLGALGWLLARPRALSGALAGDEEGLARVDVELPAAARQALRLIAVAVPSRWRWRSERGALVGRAPRELRARPDGEPAPDSVLTCGFVLHDDELELEGLPGAVRGLRGGQVELTDVRGVEAEVAFRLDFDDPAAAGDAGPAVAALLARIARDHAAHGLGYDGAWSTEGATVAGRYRVVATPDWGSVIERLVAGASRRTAEAREAGRLAGSGRAG